jgi:hypothetical protein
MHLAIKTFIDPIIIIIFFAQRPSFTKNLLRVVQVIFIVTPCSGEYRKMTKSKEIQWKRNKEKVLENVFEEI